MHVDLYRKPYSLWGINASVTRGLSRDKMLNPHDLDLGPTGTNVSDGTSAYDGEQLCKFIYKSIQK